MVRCKRCGRYNHSKERCYAPDTWDGKPINDKHVKIPKWIIGNSSSWQRRTYFLVLLSVGVCLILWIFGYANYRYFVASLIAFIIMIMWISIRRHLFHDPDYPTRREVNTVRFEYDNVNKRSWWNRFRR